MARAKKRKKFFDVEIPLVKKETQLQAYEIGELDGRFMKYDLTRILRGKSMLLQCKIKIKNDKAVAIPTNTKLLSYYLRRMVRKGTNYVEDSFTTPSQESMILIKPFLITRKRVSRVVRKTLRNKCKNWLEDYIAEKKDNEIFNEILSNKLQKSLSLMLKKTYPLSLCEIRVLEIKRQLKPEEVPKIKPKPKVVKEKQKKEIEEGLDQLAEIEEEKK